MNSATFFWGSGTWWLRILLLALPWWLSGKESACQCRRTGFSPWAGKIPPCSRATKPVRQLLRPCALATEAPGVCALQHEKPLQWEAYTLQLESSPHLRQLGKKKKACTAMKTQHSQNKRNIASEVKELAFKAWLCHSPVGQVNALCLSSSICK